MIFLFSPLFYAREAREMAILADIKQNNQEYSEQEAGRKKPGRPGKEKHNEGANQSNWIPPCFRRDRGQTSRPRFPRFPAGFRLSGLCLLSVRHFEFFKQDHT